MRFIRRRYFTLLELMIVLLTIGMIASITGIKIKESYEEQRFLSEVQQVASHLQMAQDVMLMMYNDVVVRFFRDSNDSFIAYQLDFDKPLPPQWAKILNKKYTLNSVKGLEFEGLNIQHHREIQLTFFSGGMVMSKGRITLSHKQTSRFVDLDKEQDHQIDLLGYPHYIQSTRYQKFERNKDPLLEQPKLDLYPAKIVEEIHEKKKQPQAA